MPASPEFENASTSVLPQMGNEDWFRVLDEDLTISPTSTSSSVEMLGVAFPNIAGYEVLKELGRGGMGQVFLARDTQLKRLVAVKMLREGTADAESRGRFRAEAEAVAQLQHPNFVQIHEIGEYQGRPFLVLEYVNGPSLLQFMKGNPLPPRHAAQILFPLAQAIQYAHDHGILHRDLKPGNILLQRSSEAVAGRESDAESNPEIAISTYPKITDFGLAKSIEDETKLTQTGNVVGTPNYMAPEQTDGTKKFGSAVDVYALGATLYEMLTGRPPFSGSSGVETLFHVRFQDPIAPSQLQPSVPRDLETICLKCLNKEPERRYRTAGLLADDLRRFLAGRPIVARPLGRLARIARWGRRNPVLAGLSIAVIATCLATTLSSILLARSWRHEMDARADAEASWQEARQAVDAFLTDTAADRRLKRPDLAELRKSLLLNASTVSQKLASRRGHRPEIEVERGRILLRLGEVRRDLGEKNDALVHFEEAVEIFERLAVRFPSEPRHRFDLAIVQRHLGAAYAEVGRTADADVVLGESLQHLQRLISTSPESTEYRFALGQSLATRGGLSAATSRPAEARDDFRAAITAVEPLVGSESAPPELRRRLAAYRAALAVLFNPIQPEERDQAVALLEKAIDECRSLVNAQPHDPDARHDLARACHQLAYFLHEVGSPPHIERLYREELDHLHRLVTDYPSIPDYQVDLARAHGSLAAFMYHTPRWALSLPHFKHALQIQTRLVADYPEVVAYAEDLGGSQCNLARSMINEGRLLDAVRPLDEAVSTLEKVLARDSSRTSARRYLQRVLIDRAVLNLRIEKYADAARDYGRAVELRVGRLDSHLQFAHAAALALNGNYADAVSLAKSTDPNRPADVHGHRAPHGVVDLISFVDRVSELWPTRPPLPSHIRRHHSETALAILSYALDRDQLHDPEAKRNLLERPDLAGLRRHPEFARLMKSQRRD